MESPTFEGMPISETLLKGVPILPNLLERVQSPQMAKWKLGQLNGKPYLGALPGKKTQFLRKPSVKTRPFSGEECLKANWLTRLETLLPTILGGNSLACLPPKPHLGREGYGFGKWNHRKTACPANPSNMVGVILHYVLTGQLPELDSLLRPKFAFGYRIHDNCERRAHFDAGESLLRRVGEMRGQKIISVSIRWL